MLQEIITYGAKQHLSQKNVPVCMRVRACVYTFQCGGGREGHPDIY